jgi:tight adherence protein B
MNPVDVITICSFGVVLVLGLMLLTSLDLRSKRPEARIKTRMEETFATGNGREQRKDADKTLLFKVDQKEGRVGQWITARLARLNTVAGRSGIRIVIGAGIAGFLISLAMVRFMPLPDFATPALMLGLPVLFVVKSYFFLVERFRRRFLDGFPDLLDLIVRAVRAGVPVTHVISSAAGECPEPLRSEFKLMGDSLQLGIDLEEVLGVAVRRIGVADFSFFCVCLLLQRETGGQLGETLENLANIVRTRREIRQKTKALTGEARITTKILAAVPVVIVFAFYFLNHDYIEILFSTEAGNKLLTFATISVVLGIVVINQMSKLDTSR